MASGNDPSLAQTQPAPSTRPAHKDPEQIGVFRILEKIGEGGMGIIYKAEQREPVRRLVALKVIKLGMDTKEVLARFEAERQALALMNHPNIAKVLDAGITDHGRPFFAMEHVPGVPLSQYCDENKLSTRQRLELFIPICHAIQHAHQKGIIHRDLKPSNILVTIFDGVPVPKVIDFGIAKATNHHLAQHTLYTQTGALIGTPEYMSPEQAMTSGLDVDTRTDIYALGVILYELLTGCLPFDAQTLRNAGFEGMARIIRESEPQKPSTRLTTLAAANMDIKPGTHPGVRSGTRHHADTRSLQRELRGDLDWIVLKAIEKDRTRRYETANGLAMDIRRHLDNEPVLARPPSTTYRLSRLFARHKAGVFASVAIFVALILGIIGTTVGLLRARHQRDIAVHATANEIAARKVAEKARDDANTANRVLQDLGATIGGLASVRGKVDATAKRLDDGWLLDQPEVRASCRTTLGYYYLNLSSQQDARRQFNAALDIYRRPDGSLPPKAASALNGLGFSHMFDRQPAESERLHRQALELHRKTPEGRSGAAYTLEVLSRLRDVQADPEGARRFRLESLAANIDAKTQEIDQTPKSADLYLSRGVHCLRLGRFSEAASDYHRAAELDPDNHWPWFILACIYAHVDDAEAHASAIRHLLKRHADHERVFVGERIAKAAMLRPVPPEQIEQLHKLLDRAIAANSPRGFLAWYQLSKAIGEYRAARYTSALEWADKARALRGHADQATLDLIHAMCSHHLAKPQDARRYLDTASARIETHIGKPGQDDLGENPENYLIAHTLLREARALIGPITPPAKP